MSEPLDGPPTPPQETGFQNHTKSTPVMSEAERKQALREEATERLRMLNDSNAEPLTHARTFFYSLVYWDNPVKSGIALASSLAVLFLSSYFNPLRLAAGTWTLAILFNLLFVHATVSYKRFTGKSASNPHEARIQATDNGLLDKGLVDHLVGLAVDGINLAAQGAGRIILIQDTRRSLSALGWGFAVYVFSGWLPTRWILGLAIVSVFSLPKFYAENKTLVDEHVAKANVILREQTVKAQALAQQHAGPYLEKATALGQQYGIVGKSKDE